MIRQRLRLARFLSLLLLGGSLLAIAELSNAQTSLRWWKDEQFRKELGLTLDQSKKIDLVFETSIPALVQTKDELDQEEAELSRLFKLDADEQRVSWMVDRVEATRGRLFKMRTMMLVHMRQILTPEQRTRLNALQEKWQRDHPPEAPKR